MFENLTDRLSRTMKNLRGQGRLSEENISDSLREVRMALLEADVAMSVVKEFTERVREKALGQEVIGSLSPGQALVKVVNDELVAVMGDSHDGIDLNQKPPVVILMAGRQCRELTHQRYFCVRRPTRILRYEPDFAKYRWDGRSHSLRRRASSTVLSLPVDRYRHWQRPPSFSLPRLAAERVWRLLC